MRDIVCCLAILYFLSACAVAKFPTVMNNKDLCLAEGGEWVSYPSLYPNKELREDDQRRFVCRLKTSDAGVTCTDNDQCQIACVVPVESISGEAATGQCQAYNWRNDDERTIINGKVTFPFTSTEMTKEKAGYLQKFKENRQKWIDHNIKDYDLIIEKSCYCLWGPYYGPNKVIVRKGEVKKVIYRGERRDGFKWGDDLTNEKAFDDTIDVIFEDLESKILKMTKNALLLVQYDEQYGFPTLIDYDRPDISHAHYTLSTIDFELMK